MWFRSWTASLSRVDRVPKPAPHTRNPRWHLDSWRNRGHLRKYSPGGPLTVRILLGEILSPGCILEPCWKAGKLQYKCLFLSLLRPNLGTRKVRNHARFFWCWALRSRADLWYLTCGSLQRGRSNPNHWSPSSRDAEPPKFMAWTRWWQAWIPLRLPYQSPWLVQDIWLCQFLRGRGSCRHEASLWSWVQ